MSQKLRLQIRNMHCASCVARIEDTISNLPNIENVFVNLTTASVQISGFELNTSIIYEQLSKAGFQPVTKTATLTLKKNDDKSINFFEKAEIKSVLGVVSTEWNQTSGFGKVKFLADSNALEEMNFLLAKMGYLARLITLTTNFEKSFHHRVNSLQHSTIISICLTLPIFILEMGGHFLPDLSSWITDNIRIEISHIIQFFLSTIILVGPGQQLIRDGVISLYAKLPNMNSLVAIGVITAWGYSSISTFFPKILSSENVVVYFEAAAVIITFVLLGRLLESRATEKTSVAIEKLVQLTPQTAKVKRANNIVEIPIKNVHVGDIVLSLPGERIAVDGTVIEGRSYIDESMINGEAFPNAKSPGDIVIGGTVNGNGHLQYVAKKIGKDTMLSQIIRLVEEGQSTRLPIGNIINRITKWFVPTIIGIAIFATVIWLSITQAVGPSITAGISVLIIACPCALGLAIPTSIMVGIGRSAELGVLLKRADALQSLSKIKTIAFDKTGTITTGRPEVTKIITIDHINVDDILQLAATIESYSEHPIAKAITTAARIKKLDLLTAKNFISYTGLGVSAEVDGKHVLIGNKKFMERNNVKTKSLHSKESQINLQGESTTYVAINDRISAVLGISDPLKQTAKNALNKLRKLGLKIIMITGDNSQSAEIIAKEIGINQCVANVLPDSKVTALDTLRQANGKIAFVGDGINDAPALANADVGIAVGSGTDIALDSADIILSSGDLNGVVRAIKISRAMMLNIKQNLCWAFGYNILLLPVAAGVFYPNFGLLLSPKLAAGAMVLSSLAVVTNSLRLRRYK
ncbi:MAG: heavy metal translocating P-type ATPase [Aestuariivita sp.]|nr:heavy metal translocating P-type ATPase [Aestuariivita sp.]